MSLWQYQAKAEPLEPTLTQVPASSTWYMPASEPARTHRPRPHGGTAYTQFGAEDPTSALGLDWVFRPPEAPPQRRPVREGAFALTLDVTLITAVEDLRWYAPASEPVRRHPPRQPGHWSGLLELTPVTPVDDPRWFQPVSEPARTHRPRLPGWWAGVLEPTLFVVPEVASWYVRASEPARTHRPRQPGLWAGVLEIEDLMLKWWRPASEPTRRPWRPTTEGAFLVEPGAFGTGPPACVPRRRPDGACDPVPRQGDDDVLRPRQTNRRSQRG